MNPTPSRSLSRRTLLKHGLALPLYAQSLWNLSAQKTLPPLPSRDRIEGLLLGSFLGDALGGPIEFQTDEAKQTLPNPPKIWKPGETLDDQALDACRNRLMLRAYSPLRPNPESYAHWQSQAPAGTITDDSRHKLILLHALKKPALHSPHNITLHRLAQAYLEWNQQPFLQSNPALHQISRDWLEEWEFGARWVLGERDTSRALPPERMWNGVPTCCGQMALLPLACLFPGNPHDAYLKTYELAFFDNGFGKDMNAALVAALSTALVQCPSTPPETTWSQILQTIRNTDPYRHSAIRYMTRPTIHWLDFALDSAEKAQQQPALLFQQLDNAFHSTTKWEAQVPFVVALSCLSLCPSHPLAALQLSLEWGHDTDSYAQIVGALIGALHGSFLFPSEWKSILKTRLEEDYHVHWDKEIDLLMSYLGRE